MKEHPVLFNGPMVRAILDGRKTQTRRAVKPQPIYSEGGLGGPPTLICNHGGDFPCAKCHRYGIPGDRPWVRETWGVANSPFSSSSLHYKATHGTGLDEPRWVPASGRDWFETHRDEIGSKIKWRPSIHMPRWASRITLEVTAVRVERLQEISEAGAKAEGVKPRLAGVADMGNGLPMTIKTHRTGFVYAWQKLNAKRGHSWESNPWVWVITFRLLEDQ